MSRSVTEADSREGRGRIAVLIFFLKKNIFG
jgi:hypothetical protein